MVAWTGPTAFSLHIRRYIYNDLNFSKLFYRNVWNIVYFKINSPKYIEYVSNDLNY